MNLKELQQKINELVEQGHGDAIVCTFNKETLFPKISANVYPIYSYYRDEEGYTNQDFLLL